MKRIIRRIATCLILHHFLIANNDEGYKHYYQDHDDASNIDADNELNRPVNDASNENERRNQLTDFLAQECMQIQ